MSVGSRRQSRPSGSEGGYFYEEVSISANDGLLVLRCSRLRLKLRIEVFVMIVCTSHLLWRVVRR